MRAYVYGVVCAAIAVGIAEILIPERASTRPYLKLLFGIALLFAVIKPIGELAELMPAVGEEIFEPIKEDSYAQLSDKHLSSAYAEGISADLRSSFGLSDFSVGVVLDGEGKPQRVAVTLFGKDIFKNPYAIEERISKAFSCECTVTVG
jgi:hypothetical protein